MQPRDAGPPVVVFDFDGTLVSRDSFLDFSLRYCLRRPHRLVPALALLPLALPLALCSARLAGSLLLWTMTVGCRTRAFVAALHSYAQRRLRGCANEAIFAELDRHARAGSRLVIATGTVPVLVRRLLHARQVGPLPIVGSRLRRRFGGLTVETHCTGQTKVSELARRLDISSWSCVYTDSFADRPLLRGARDITLVAPRRSTLRRTRRLIEPTTVLRVLWPSQD